MRFNNKNWALPPIQSDDSLYFEANSASTIKLYQRGGAWTTFEYSIDDKATWNNFTTSSNISLATGDRAYFRAKQTRATYDNDSDITIFDIQGNVKAVGNIMYLYDYEHPENRTVTYARAFKGIFEKYWSYSSCIGLTDVEDLIMPEVLSAQCCINMFLGSGIISSPVLPATTLTERCYEGMFAGCAITKVTMLARTFGTNSLRWWLQSTTGSGTKILYKNPLTSVDDFPPTDGRGSNIPAGWTVLDYAG